MHHISNNVVIAGRETGVVNSGSAIVGTGSGDVMHVVTDDSDERGPIQDGNPDVASDVESHDIHVVSVVGPHRVGTAAAQLCAPLHIGNKTDTGACRPADRAVDSSISTGGDVHRGAGRNAVGRMLDSCPRSRWGTAVGVTPAG